MSKLTLLFAFICLVAIASAANLALDAPTNVSPVLSELTEKAVSNPATGTLSPIQMFHQILKRMLANCIYIMRQILQRIQHWILHTTDYLEILQARQILPQMLNRVLQNVVVWMRGFVQSEYQCIGRVLCEFSDQASNYMPVGLKQVFMIYLSTNQESNLYYRPLANGFISASSCPLLYGRCDQQGFLQKLEHFNVTIPEFGNDIEEVVSTFGKSTNIPEIESAFSNCNVPSLHLHFHVHLTPKLEIPLSTSSKVPFAGVFAAKVPIVRYLYRSNRDLIKIGNAKRNKLNQNQLLKRMLNTERRLDQIDITLCPFNKNKIKPCHTIEDRNLYNLN